MGNANTEKLMWFVAGASLGAAVALLFAPASGTETRRYLGQKTDMSREAFAESSREFMEKSRELYDKGRRLADDAAEMFNEGRKLVEG